MTMNLKKERCERFFIENLDKILDNDVFTNYLYECLYKKKNGNVKFNLHNGEIVNVAGHFQIDGMKFMHPVVKLK